MARRVHVKKNWLLDPHKTWTAEVAELSVRVRQRPLKVLSGPLFLFLWVLLGDFTWAVTLMAGIAACAFAVWTRLMEDRLGRHIGYREAWRVWRRRGRILRRWDAAMATLRLMAKGGQLKGRTPTLRKLHLTEDGSMRAVTVSGPLGITPEDLGEAADRIAHTIQCRAVEVRALNPGVANVIFRDGDALSEVVTPARMPAGTRPEKGEPPRLAYGVRSDGSPQTLSLATSALIVGVTGSGKSSVMWALLAGCLQQRIPVRLRVADIGGGSEFAALERAMEDGQVVPRFKVHRYTDRPTEVDAEVKTMRRAMESRLADMKDRGVRWHVASDSEPYDILVIDELLLLGDMLKKGVHSDLGALLSQGRKAGFLVWAATQMGQKEGVGPCRDLFHQRLCFATGNREMTQAALGGSSSVLPPAHAISESERGVGYAYDSQVRGFTRFRSVFIDDRAAAVIARGQLPPGMGGTPVDESAAVYAFYGQPGCAPDSEVPDRDLLYVGKSIDPPRRFAEHNATQDWRREIKRVEVVSWHPSEAEALAEEKRLTLLWKPRENVANNPTGRRRRRAAASA